MNFAEGKGPKQKKQAYVLGQFQSVYGQDGAPGVTPFTGTAYTPVQGSTNISGQTWLGGQVGSVVPGLNVGVNGNALVDYGFVCSPGSSESVQDLLQPWVTLTTDAFFAGSGVVTLQGTSNRFLNPTTSGSNWVNIPGLTVTVSNTNATYTIGSGSGTVPVYNAYRLTISGYTGCSGIVNWTIAGMFTDFNAMSVGVNAADANGGIGQLSVQGPRYLTIQSGQVTVTVNGNVPYASTSNNHDYIG